MTTFNQIYHEAHESNDGTIEIANSTSNLSKVYIVIDTINIADKLEQPLLIGFLYQVDSTGKRSKPYPVVSLMQTIGLDMSECTQFLFVLVNRLISAYDLLLFVSTESDGSSPVDLSAYALISQLPDLSPYALISELPDLTPYALKTELPTGGSSDGFIAISSNSNLESNKKYLAAASGLVCALPSSPSIGDKIALATGNFSFRVNHGNGSQSILNLSTQSTVGTDSGIILKPYSSIELIYLGSNLWVSSFRSRTINNWLTATVSSGQPIAYTPSDNHAGENGSSSDGINDNVTVGGSGFASSYFARVGAVDFTLTLASEIELDGFDYYAGQGNATGGTQANSPNTLSVYSDAGKTNLLGSFTLGKTADTKQSFSLNLGGNAYSSYVFAFVNTEVSDRLSFMELDLFGKLVTGGEVTAS